MRDKFNPEFWAERLDLPYVANNWYNYKFQKSLGLKTFRKGAIGTKMGTVTNVSGRRLHQHLYSMLPAMLNGEWEKCCSLYGGIIAFLLKRCRKDITYFEHSGRRDGVTVKDCCENLHFPMWAKENLEKVLDSTFSFEDYLHGFDKTNKVNFDIESAMMIVKMQGDDAIFSVLMQLFHTGKYITTNTANLVPSLPIIWTPEVSHLANNTGFPVVATKFSDKLEWRWVDHNLFLFDEFNNVIDCACVGSFNVFKESLGNRLSFLSRSGFSPVYVVCWTYDDLFDAVQIFGGDLLIRNFNGKWNSWHKFGPNAQLIVETRNERVFGYGSKKPLPNVEILPIKNSKRAIDVITICQEKVDVVPTEKPIWTSDELLTWFEIGKICKKKLKEDFFHDS